MSNLFHIFLGTVKGKFAEMEKQRQEEQRKRRRRKRNAELSRIFREEEDTT